MLVLQVVIIKDDNKKCLQVICQFGMYLIMKDWHNIVASLENMLSETIFAMSTLNTNKPVVGSFRRRSSPWPELQEKADVGRCKPTQEVKDK